MTLKVLYVYDFEYPEAIGVDLTAFSDVLGRISVQRIGEPIPQDLLEDEHPYDLIIQCEHALAKEKTDMTVGSYLSRINSTRLRNGLKPIPIEEIADIESVKRIAAYLQQITEIKFRRANNPVLRTSRAPCFT
jgi:hypothetical protein